MDFAESISILNKWWWQDDIWRVTLQFLGAPCKNFHLEKGLNRLSDSLSLRNAMLSTSCEYLAVEGRQINEDKEKFGTGRSVKKEEYLSYYVNYENPPLGLCQSVWQKDVSWENSAPKRALFYFDIEYFNNKDNKPVLLEQEDVISSVEPVYSLIRSVLLDFGINHMAILSGRGYNFVSSVTPSSPVFAELVKIGGNIEPTLEEKQKYPAFKRQRPVNPEAELSFKGSLRLVLFLAGLIIHEARKHSLLPIEMSDQGSEGISLDLTMLTRSVDTSTCSVPTSPYLKIHFQKNLPLEIVYNTIIPVRLIRASGEHENFPHFREMIRVRNNYYEAAEHFSGQTGFIPDGSTGIANLIRLYKKSPLSYFHYLMDSEEHEPYSEWWRTYRNYSGICNQFPHLAHLIYNPNPALLQPDNLNSLINDFMDRGWHPKHIGGFIRSIYEDDLLGKWGTRFWKYDAAKWANGWVEILGAQRYFGVD